jgi:hypothetical protein
VIIKLTGNEEAVLAALRALDPEARRLRFPFGTFLAALASSTPR